MERRLLRRILGGYRLDPLGIHGLPHWARVLQNGRRLAEKTGADLEVVRLFALLHDSRRVNEDDDPGHGRRGAALAATLRGELIRLEPARFERLHYACAHHTDGIVEADRTVQTCWDADRLDLGRVLITPDPGRPCTAAARDPEMIAWADGRARAGAQPPEVARWLALAKEGERRGRDEG